MTTEPDQQNRELVERSQALVDQNQALVEQTPGQPSVWNRQAEPGPFGDEHEEAAPGRTEEDAEFILSMDFEEAEEACKDNGLPVSADLQKMQQALLVHFTWSEPESRAAVPTNDTGLTASTGLSSKKVKPVGVAAGSPLLTDREPLARPKPARDGKALDTLAQPKLLALHASVPICRFQSLPEQPRPARPRTAAPAEAEPPSARQKPPALPAWAFSVRTTGVHCTDEAHSDHANGSAMHVHHQGEEWLIKTDPGSGQTYYVHRDSKRSQWHAPTDAHP